MNILLLSEYFPLSIGADITGGVEARAYNLATSISKRHQVLILTSRRGENDIGNRIAKIAITRIGPAYPYTQAGHVFSRVAFGANLVYAAIKVARAQRVEVIDGCSFFTYPAAILAGIIAGTRVRLTYHEVWLGKWRSNTRSSLGVLGEFAERAILLLAQLLQVKIISVSEFTRQQLINAGYPATLIEVIPNGVTLQDYESVRVQKRPDPTICFVGRLTEHKRVDDLIHALPAIKRRVRDVRCVIVGDGPVKKTLQNLAADLGLASIVTFTGFLPHHADVIRKIKSSHVFCSPSVVEGFGITLLEAMACGIPFACADIEAFSEVSGGGKGGILCAPGSPQAYADAITRLLTDRKRYDTCEREGRQRAARFNWSAIAKELERNYHS